MNLDIWDKYGKSIVAFLYAIAVVFIPLFSGDHHIDPSEGIIIALAVGNNIIVYLVPLTPRFASVKTVVNALLAALAVVQTTIEGGITGNDWLLIAAAFFGALGVWLAPAASTKGPDPVVVRSGLTA